ncbi:MAG: Hsp20 family protein [Armatimonadetes bacterium]|nr:Hsp20 family protein [Armatimonadota bacterium]
MVADQAKAVFKDGVLEIRLPKTEQAKELTPKKVTVE